jgi:hypothetical protein
MAVVETVKATVREYNIGKKPERKATVNLPTVKNVPPQKLSDSIIVIYGRKGIGKTSLAANFDNALVAMFERGRRNLPIMMIPQEGEDKLNWESFRAYVEAFLESEFDTLVIDTVDKAYECCLDWVCKQNNCTHPNDKNDYGKTWGMVKREFDSTLGAIHDSGKGLVLISHETTKQLSRISKGLLRDTGTEQLNLERFEPSCSKQAFEVIQEICDYVFYYGYREEFRCITVRSPNDLVWTSCGFADKFLDPDGNTINAFKVGSSPEEAYKNLIAAHANQIRDFDYVEPREKPLIKKRGE